MNEKKRAEQHKNLTMQVSIINEVIKDHYNELLSNKNIKQIKANIQDEIKMLKKLAGV